MNLFHLSPETIAHLQKCIGGTLEIIHTQGGTVSKGDGVVFRGYGMLSLVVYKATWRYKWRLGFHESSDTLYSECYAWEHTVPFKERYNPRTTEVNYDFDGGEGKKYPICFRISNKTEEWNPAANTIKSIKIYHYVGIFDHEAEEEAESTESHADCLAFIDFETETGRRIIIYAEDVPDCYEIHFDDLELLNYRLAEIHDDPGKTFGLVRYPLRHELR
ncbi:MAG: hypothetical protein J0L99_00160 [Chitinophagales bacterium]|nr:hypothetical protein [Chitinophagales bacterium]